MNYDESIWRDTPQPKSYPRDDHKYRSKVWTVLTVVGISLWALFAWWVRK